MASSRTLKIEVVGDASRAEKELHKLRGSLGSTGASFKRLAVAASAGFAALGAGKALAGSVSAASELNEEINKANVLFGQSAKAVQEWSKTTASGIGIARQQALEAAGGFGAMLETAGLNEKQAAAFSTRLVKLAADMASFNNIDPTEALDKLRSGLAGEAEPLRRVGVLLSETRVQQEAYRTGLAKVGQKLTEQQKVQARYALILKDTARQHGDFARTSSGLANSQRILRASLQDISAQLGSVFLPIVTKATAGFAAFLGRFAGAKTARARFSVVFEGIEGAAGRVVAQLRDAFRNTNWQQVFSVVGEQGRKALEQAGRALAGVNWTAVAREISARLKQSLEGIAAFLGSVDWSKVGGAIVRGVVDFLKGVDWVGLFKGVVRLWVAGLKAGASLLLGVGKELGRSIIDGLRAALSGAGEVIKKAALKIVLKILGAFSFLGRFDPFKGLRERARATLRGIEADALRTAAVVATAFAPVHGAEGRAPAPKAEKSTVSTARQVAREQAQTAAVVQTEATKAAAATRKTANAVDKLADEQNRLAAKIAARNAAQFKALNLTATGQQRIPGVEALQKRLGSITKAVAGTFLDTAKTRARLKAIGKVLSGQFGAVGRDVRASIQDMFRDITDALNGGTDSLKGPLTKTSGLNTKKVLAGLGLSADQERELRGRLSHFNTAGRALAGSQAPTGSFVVDVNLTNTTVLDGQKVGMSVTRHQQRANRRNPKQKRGPNRKN